MPKRLRMKKGKVKSFKIAKYKGALAVRRNGNISFFDPESFKKIADYDLDKDLGRLL